MIFVVVEPFFFINEIMYFCKFFHPFIFAKYILTLNHLPLSGNLKADHPQNHEHISLRMNDQILMTTQLQWKKMNGKRMM
jgi:hypothetical protein